MEGKAGVEWEEGSAFAKKWRSESVSVSEKHGRPGGSWVQPGWSVVGVE